MKKYLLRLVLFNNINIVRADVIPEAEKAYVFNGLSGKAYFIGEVEMYSKDTYRVIEGNPLAFKEASNVLKNPITIDVEIAT